MGWKADFIEYLIVSCRNLHRMKRFLLILFCVLLSATVFGETEYSGLNLSDDNLLLFRAITDSPMNGVYSTLFSARLVPAKLSEKTIKQLSFFPEMVTYLAETDQLQIQNRFGVFRTEHKLKNMKPVSRFPGFVNGRQIKTGKLDPIVASPDGRYLLYINSTSFGYGELILYVVAEDREVTIANNVELSFSGPKAIWSPNSNYFVYCVQGELYYYSIDQFEQNRVFAQKLRYLGKGRINNVRWNRQNNLYYIRDSLVYEIISSEFFTRSLYSEILSIGSIIGKIPFTFDSNFDSFWISPKGTRILLNKGGRNLFLYYLGTEDFVYTGETETLPYLFLPRNTRVKRIAWSNSDIITVLTQSIRDGITQSHIFRFNPEETDGKMIFYRTNDQDVIDMVLAPDERRIALMRGNEVRIRRYRSWKEDKTFAHAGPLHVVWKSDMELLISGRYLSERISFNDEHRDIICFSQIEEYGFSKINGNIQVKVLGGVYEMVDDGSWLEKSELEVGPAKLYSKDYRVYLENAPGVSYKNLVMIRDQKGYEGTKPLFQPPSTRYETFPEEEEEISFFNFNHGSRIRRREVSLVFNAIDDVEGLTEIMNTMAEYDIKATFFINGEFIRRNPGAVKEIATSRHEVGSLFYTYFNLTDAKYTIEDEFIKQGLARNEDDYFRITGEELSLLWHAPYYFVNSQIIQAAEEMNYQYVGRDIDPLDWVTEEYAERYDGFYMPSGKLVERILELKKPGSIIPIRVGTPDGERDDYLFQKLDNLINGLISLGYSIVPVSTLIEHAR